ncbi:peptidylprolyl isomerase [Dolichospermum sp. ST_sed3]|nr:peptidylprolyl isomerase [Dolichospermum sp. ST_sed3]
MATNNLPDPIVTNPINNVIVNIDAPDTTINLSNYFDDPLTTGKVAHFNLANTLGGTIGNGIINVVLFDQTAIGAPLTVQNFQSYVTAGSYTNSFIHRSIPGFIVQGGGYTYNNSTFGEIPANPAVQNEFSINRSNLRGTIAMAKLGSDPNSATNEWFFNLANNSINLDKQNGGFTVFGQAIATNDLTTIDAIANVPIYNGGGAFTDIPLTQVTQSPIIDTNFIRFSSITVSQEDELKFSIVGNSQPTLVTPKITNQQLVLDYLPNQTGNSDITIRATNLFGEFIDYKFTVNISKLDNIVAGTIANENFSTTAAKDIIDAQGGNDTITSSFDNLQQNDTINGGTDNDILIITGGTATNAISISVNNTNNQLNIVGTTIINFEQFDLSGFGGKTNFLGAATNDWMKAGTGNDILNGGAGADTLTGGVGNDSYYVDNAADSIIENANQGTDRVFTTITYTLAPTLENLTLQGTTAINGTGNGLNNSITGNTAANVLTGGAGADTLIGGVGNDSYYVDNAADSIIENANEGTDRVFTTITYTLAPTLENLTLQGTTAINGTGNDLNNSITGNAAANVITGGAGADTLIGGLGNDNLSLGLNDNAVDNIKYVLDDGVDTVTQFIRGIGGDKLNFSGITNLDVKTSGTSTQIRVGDGIGGNAGFGTGLLLVTLSGTTGFVAGDVNVNLFGGNFLFS